MKRYVLFDKETGEILHTHQAYKLESEDLEKVPDDEIIQVVNRTANPERVGVLLTDEPIQSSNRFARKVDPKSGKVVTTELPEDFWTKKASKKNQLQKGPEGGD